MNKNFNYKNVFLIFMVVVIIVVGLLYREVVTYKNLYLSVEEKNQQLELKITDFQHKIDKIEKNQDRIEETEIQFYMDKLKDKSFTGFYGHGYIWYTAAENLGMIGKPAVPYLINNLETKDDYERTLTLYALLLATQHENVQEFTKGEYIHTSLDFEVSEHDNMKKTALDWWEKYKDNWE